MFLFKCKVSLKLINIGRKVSMSLGFTGYSSLNGLGLITGGTSGYGGYGYYGGLSDSTYVENAKTSIANSYALRTTQQSFSGLQNAEKASFNLECQTIKDMLQDGRSDDAIATFNDLVDEMSELNQYQGYDESYIRTMVQSQYATACGSTLLGDISRYTDSSFMSGIKNSNPLSIFLCQSSSEADLKAEVTGKSVSNSDIFAKGLGAAAGGAGVAIAGSALLGVNSAYKAAKSGVASGKLGEVLGAAGKGIWDRVKNLKGSKVKGIAIMGAVIGIGCLAVKGLFNKASDSVNA